MLPTHSLLWKLIHMLNTKSKQASEISRRQIRVKEAPIPENVAKLHAAELKMQELKANMAVLGKEAAAALSAIEAQQQRLTFQRLVGMVPRKTLANQKF